MRTAAVAVVELVAAGVNVTATTGPDPTPAIVPDAGVVTEVPGTEPVAF